MTEEYKMIQDFENYEISNLGNVRNKKTNKILKQSKGTDGYYKVSLYQQNKHYNKRIHKLIAEAFIPNPDNKPCVDHIDNDKLNNNITNLRWATTKENAQNAKLYVNSTSFVKGVYFDKAKQKWRARIQIDGVRNHLGLYNNIEDAKAARVARANAEFGTYKNSCEN